VRLDCSRCRDVAESSSMDGGPNNALSPSRAGAKRRAADLGEPPRGVKRLQSNRSHERTGPPGQWQDSVRESIEDDPNTRMQDSGEGAPGQEFAYDSDSATTTSWSTSPEREMPFAQTGDRNEASSPPPEGARPSSARNGPRFIPFPARAPTPVNRLHNYFGGAVPDETSRRGPRAKRAKRKGEALPAEPRRTEHNYYDGSHDGRVLIADLEQLRSIARREDGAHEVIFRTEAQFERHFGGRPTLADKDATCTITSFKQGIFQSKPRIWKSIEVNKDASWQVQDSERNTRFAGLMRSVRQSARSFEERFLKGLLEGPQSMYSTPTGERQRYHAYEKPLQAGQYNPEALILEDGTYKGIYLSLYSGTKDLTSFEAVTEKYGKDNVWLKSTYFDYMTHPEFDNNATTFDAAEKMFCEYTGHTYKPNVFIRTPDDIWISKEWYDEQNNSEKDPSQIEALIVNRYNRGFMQPSSMNWLDKDLYNDRMQEANLAGPAPPASQPSSRLPLAGERGSEQTSKHRLTSVLRGMQGAELAGLAPPTMQASSSSPSPAGERISDVLARRPNRPGASDSMQTSKHRLTSVLRRMQEANLTGLAPPAVSPSSSPPSASERASDILSTPAHRLSAPDSRQTAKHKLTSVLRGMQGAELAGPAPPAMPSSSSSPPILGKRICDILASRRNSESAEVLIQISKHMLIPASQRLPRGIKHYQVYPQNFSTKSKSYTGNYSTNLLSFKRQEIFPSSDERPKKEMTDEQLRIVESPTPSPVLSDMSDDEGSLASGSRQSSPALPPDTPDDRDSLASNSRQGSPALPPDTPDDRDALASNSRQSSPSLPPDTSDDEASSHFQTSRRASSAPSDTRELPSAGRIPSLAMAPTFSLPSESSDEEEPLSIAPPRAMPRPRDAASASRQISRDPLAGSGTCGPSVSPSSPRGLDDHPRSHSRGSSDRW
jgi:hypothetical protein